MAISRAQLAKELEPGLNALFGMEYDRYENQHCGNLHNRIFGQSVRGRSYVEWIWRCAY